MAKLVLASFGGGGSGNVAKVVLASFGAGGGGDLGTCIRVRHSSEVICILIPSFSHRVPQVWRVMAVKGRLPGTSSSS